MKRLTYVFITTLCLVILTGCGQHQSNVVLEKDGTEYTTSQGVSFYYPKDYKVTLDSQNNDVVEFIEGESTYYFHVISDETDNAVEDKDDLYAGELEQQGASNIEISQPVLNSGLNVYEYSATYQETSIKTEEIVYFGDSQIYVYGYRSTEDNYDSNIDNVKVYLQTFSMTTGK